MNQKQETLKFFIKKGFLLDNELLDFFTEIDDRELAKDILDKISMISKVRVISKEMITANFTEIKPLF